MIRSTYDNIDIDAIIIVMMTTHPRRIDERHVVPGVEATLLQQQARDLLRLLVQLGAGQRLQDLHVT